MKPTTKILLLLACSVSPVPFFPITGATPIPPTNSLDLLPSLPTRDIHIVDGGLQVSSLRPRDSLIRFPTEPTRPDPPFPQLTLPVLDADVETILNLWRYRAALQQKVKFLQDDPEIRTCRYDHYEQQVRKIIETSDDLIFFEYSLVKNGVIGYGKYKPKLIYTMIELLKVFLNHRSSKDLRDFMRNYIAQYADLEGRSGRKYSGVTYNGPFANSIMEEGFTGDELLKELEKELVAIRERSIGTHPVGHNFLSLALPFRPAPGPRTGSKAHPQR
ncbi:hypothetical protein H0H93_014378 [Arthromyces matolae]|nr:hypothetical protein H0H93_014378 [Arthromyces matolae]